MMKYYNLIYLLIFIVLSPVGGCVSSHSTQNVGVGQTILHLPSGMGIVKFIDSQKTWSKQAYISTEPTNTLFPSVTISRDSVDRPPNASRQGGQNYVTVPAKEFDCLESIYQKSFVQSHNVIGQSPHAYLPFNIFFHGALPHSDSIITNYNSLNSFFLALIEGIQHDSNCLSEGTKAEIIPLLNLQKSYVAYKN